MPAYYDGLFPFCVPQVAEDGLPFSTWDGSTMYQYTGFTPEIPWVGTLLEYEVSQPSKASGSLITVVGSNSRFCVPLTLEQAVELYWEGKKFQAAIKVADRSFAYDVAATATATGGSYSDDGMGGWIWNAGSVALSNVPLLLTNGTITDQTSERTTVSEVREVVCLKVPTTLTNISASDTNAQSGSVAYVAPPARSGSSLIANLSGEVSFQSNNLSDIPIAYPGSMNLVNMVQTGPNEFWWAPAPYAGTSLGFVLEIYGMASQEEPSGAAPTIVYYRVTRSKQIVVNESAVTIGATGGSRVYGTPTYGGMFPVSITFRDGTVVTATAFGVSNNSELETKNIPAAPSSMVVIPALSATVPTIEFTTLTYLS